MQQEEHVVRMRQMKTLKEDPNRNVGSGMRVRHDKSEKCVLN